METQTTPLPTLQQVEINLLIRFRAIIGRPLTRAEKAEARQAAADILARETVRRATQGI